MNTSGDHSTTYTPKGLDVQEYLRNYENEHVTQSQHDWIASYVEGERESNDDLIDPKTGELVQHVYQLYEVPIHDIPLKQKQVKTGFSTFLYRAIAAKANIGLSTNDGWVFNMILDLYQKYYEINNGRYVRSGNAVSENDSSKPMYRLTEEQRDELSFTYTKALQDFVVRGVKHTENGSEDFEVLFLRNFSKPENAKTVFRLLTHDLKLPTTLANKMMFVVTWAQETGYASSCAAFLKLYNKGTVPSEEDQELLDMQEDFIQSNTYFGMLLEPVYRLRKFAQSLKGNRNSKIIDFINQSSILDQQESKDQEPLGNGLDLFF